MRLSPHRSRSWLALSLCCTLSSACALAQAPAPRPTLAESLRKAPPAQGVVLSVDADRVTLPAEAAPAGTDAAAGEIAGLYGRSAQRFGDILAVAPPTMIVVNTAPGEPNIYAGMRSLDAFTLLLASLTEPQWKALTSEAGLGAGTLNAQQQQMFAAILSAKGKLIVRPQYTAGEKWDDRDKRDVTDELPRVHLRIGQTIAMVLPSKDHPDWIFGDAAIPPPAGAPRQYQIDDRQDYSGSSDTDFGALVRAEVPNVPKRGQLDFSLKSLRTPISLDGLKTVGDLVYRVGNAAGIELYVDPRLEKRALTLSGVSSAPAGDLLRSLAFCLTGTFRQVGPAYVLTDDIVGVGTRRQIWTDFEKEADVLSRGPVRAANYSLFTAHHPSDLPWFGDPSAYTPEQIKGAGEQSINMREGFLPELKLPMAQLTPAQQDMARRAVEKWNREYTLQPVTADGQITLRPGLSTQLLIPSIDTPVDLSLNGSGGTEQFFVFQMPPDQVKAMEKADQEKRLKEHPEYASLMNQTPPKAPLADAWAKYKDASRRAAIVHPRSVKEVDAAVAAAKALGLNELWVDVFSEGAAHIPATDAASSKTQSDILTEALARTKSSPIRILPMVDLLFWGDDPPAENVDLNLLGETSEQAATHWRQLKALLPEDEDVGDEHYSHAIIPNWSGVIVAPTAPGVQTTLTALVKSLSSRPGIAGMVWRGGDTPGYDALPGDSDTSSLLLGYHEAARLLFLRQFHADPLDIYDGGHSGSKANTDTPNFSENGSGREEYDLHSHWVKFRQDASLAFLRTLYASANPSGTPPARRVRVLVKQRRAGQPYNDASGVHYPSGWYGSWDNPLQPPPTLREAGDDDVPGQPAKPVLGEAAQAQAQSQIVMNVITEQRLDQMRAQLGFSAIMAARPKPPVARPTPPPAAKPPASQDFVLDLGDTSGVGALTDFAARVTAPPPADGGNPPAK
ncbi:hypothetical protein CCAX7_31370 [Capsulimonas corticalis]|uniref:Uncharacterized protein n=1 Tax=Capsulimonas corticalis TaxID=2219043 RepID=A0A402CSH7_9BACT|nr:hypothetical protein [Capsulimonas corticalis]BDI31086.1 hypothetical protein CCAX7_31370 [Capsulimonas corticalis]